MSAPRKTPAEVFDTYLGMLYPTADYKVYGYISNTRIKFMLVLDDTQKDEKMRMVSTCLHHSTQQKLKCLCLHLPQTLLTGCV